MVTKAQGSTRDRFVGFAFASAHLLLETDNQGCILFAAGARCGLVIGALSDLVGHTLFDFLPVEEHSILAMLFQRLIKKGKLDVTQITMRAADGRKFSAHIGACRLPNYSDRCFLSVSIRGQATGRQAGRRLPDLDSFLPVLESRLVAANATEISQALSMVLIDGLQDIKNNPQLRDVLEAYFLSISSDGDSAVKLTGDHYAVLHSDEGAILDIEHDINQILVDNRAADLSASTHLWRVDVGKTYLPTSDVARAIAFPLKTFAAGNFSALNITNINSVVENILTTTVKRVSEARTTLERKNFRLVYQPIVRLTTGQLHHVEALMRLGKGDSPAEFVNFAEGIGPGQSHFKFVR
ncbi:MAG: EAL domain-containing protein [Rhodospirillaceae bacterium]